MSLKKKLYLEVKKYLRWHKNTWGRLQIVQMTWEKLCVGKCNLDIRFLYNTIGSS